MFIWILVGLFCLALLLSVFSLWKDLRKNIKTEHVTEELAKGRVIFHAPSASDTYTDTTVPNHETTTAPIPSEPILQTPVISPVHTEPMHTNDIPTYNQEVVISSEGHPEVNAETKTEVLPGETPSEKDTEV